MATGSADHSANDSTKWTPRSLKETRLRELDAQMAAGSVPTALRFERACLLAEIGRTAEARDAYLDVLRREPAHRAALNNLGTLLYQSGYRTASRTAYFEAVARHPDDPMSLVNLANVLRESGDLATARQHYETALRLQPDHAEAHQGLASVLADSGDAQGAARHRRLAFGERPVVVLPYRGETLPVQLLLLAGASGATFPYAIFWTTGSSKRRSSSWSFTTRRPYCRRTGWCSMQSATRIWRVRPLPRPARFSHGPQRR